MITKAQAVTAFQLGELHYTGRHECTRTVGPRGGVTETITRVRVSGQCQTWKTRPAEFRLPVKYGMWESGAITEANAADFHVAADCPLRSAQNARDEALRAVVPGEETERMIAENRAKENR